MPRPTSSVTTPRCVELASVFQNPLLEEPPAGDATVAERRQYDTFVAHWRSRNLPDAYVTFALRPDGSIDTMKMAAVSPLADFSFDYADLLFVPVW